MSARSRLSFAIVVLFLELDAMHDPLFSQSSERVTDAQANDAVRRGAAATRD